MANDYKPGQVWKDRDNYQWFVSKNLVTGEVHFKDSVGNGIAVSEVEERWSPLELQYDAPEVRMAFTTKDSGERAGYESGMVRDTDKGKARFDLLIPEGIPYDDQMLTRFANLMARGAEKYDPRNWEQANSKDELDRFKGSAFRHFMMWYCGLTDEDHAAAILFNVTAHESTRYKIEEGV